jgi:hypothetical protein
MTSDNVPAPPSQPNAENAGAHDESDKTKDTANDSSSDLALSAACYFIFDSRID